MKKLILSLTIALASFLGFSQDSGVSITVIVDNVTNNKGKVSMALHTADTFMKSKGIMSTETDIKDGKVTLTFKNVQAGQYAIMVLHDENNNKKMDYMENGMPLESYGMSNNAMTMGPPQYDDAKFEVENEDLTLHIRF
ncbi:DUF2141 domain-containing protein [Winogradskyella wichelsiae]|uniref:DUF2141 domain-containing protein n=1 Tax=Winogradskyella wichelsiae TaxID=2697007 RepID=UPI0015CEA29D|nr:DUF2141 domain-containing protein [Winogradskyella wichelsiae]